VAIVASAAMAYAAPAADVLGRSTFELFQESTGQKVFRSGAIEQMKVYNKYAKHGAVAPSHVVDAAAAAARQSGSVAANPEQYNEAYLVPVTVGANKLNLDFDTGSSDLWVFSTVTPSSESSGHNLYNAAHGTLEQGETWQISYGDGSGASGVVYADSVTVGPVTATSQAVEAATSVSSEFVQDPSDGLLGLAFSSINTVQPNQATTFFDTVKSTLASPLFTADLKHNTAGSYGFGYIDSSKYTGSITYTSVNTANGFWQFTAGGYSVGSSKTTSGSIGSAIADTGTSLFYLPDAAVSAYYKKVSGATNSYSDGGYIFPCSATLPNFNVAIGGSVFTVPGSYINFAPNGDGTCFGGIQSSDGIGFNIFGDVFLESVFVVFSETTSSPRIGFAQQA